MCHYITATLPESADINKAREIFFAHKLGFEEIENKSIKEQLEKGDHYVLTTNGICDCGTVLGSEFRESMSPISSKIDKETAAPEKLRKKGWSEAKIARWLKESELTKEKEEQKRQLAYESNLSSSNAWLSFIRDVLTSKASNRIGLLIHMYRGPLTGRIKIKGKKTITLSKLTEDMLLNMEEDLIYNFVTE